MGLLCYVRALCTHTYSRYRCVCVCIENTTYVCLYRVLLLLFHSLLESDKWMTQCGGAGCIISTWLNWHKKSSQKMMQTGTICEFSLIVVNKTYAQKKTRLWSLAGLLLVVFCLLSRRQTGPPKRHPWNTTDIYLFFVCWPRTPILCPWLVPDWSRRVFWSVAIAKNNKNIITSLTILLLRSVRRFRGFSPDWAFL